MKKKVTEVQRKRPIENSREFERFARKSKPIYEDIRWRFIISLVLLALVTLIITELFMYDELTKSITPDQLEMAELTLSMFVIFDLLLVIRYVPDKTAFLKKNWMKALLIIPSWMIVKPFALIGLDQILPTIASQHNIAQMGRGVNFFDNVKDFIDKL